MVQGEGDNARRTGWCKERGAMQEGDSARRRGRCREKDDVTEAALCSSCFQSQD